MKTILALFAVTASAASAQTLQTIPSMTLNQFQDSFGVNIHAAYQDGEYSNEAQTLADLQYIGVHNVRDEIQTPADLPQGLVDLQDLALHGMKLDLIYDPNNSTFAAEMQEVVNFATKYPGSVGAVEGPNEINNFPVANVPAGESQDQAATAVQRNLYNFVHASAALKGVPVYFYTGNQPVNLAANAGLADFANGHPYPHNGDQPTYWLQNEFATHFTTPGSYPKVATETGYATIPNPSDPDGVDDTTQGEEELNLLFDAAAQGITRTYLYQLKEPYADVMTNPDTAYGLFRWEDGSPKPIAEALHNIIDKIPADKPSKPKQVQAIFADVPSTFHSLAVTASDGTLYLWSWNEAPVWDPQTDTHTDVPPTVLYLQVPGYRETGYFTPQYDQVFPLADQAGTYNGQPFWATLLFGFPTVTVFQPVQ